MTGFKKSILEGERARKIFDGFSCRKRVEELCKDVVIVRCFLNRYI
ncbi:MAG: hypothetical protein ACLTY6_11565 [Clostridium perfringens]